MKRKIIFPVMLLVFAGITMMQSCKESPLGITEHNTFDVPVAVAPLNATTIASTTTTTLKWLATGGASNNWAVYFGTSSSPHLYKSGITAQSLTVPVVEGKTYHWYVETVDSRGVPTDSPVFSFSVAINLDISTFTGLYDVDEGGYLYQVTLTKIDANTLESNNFWDNAPNPLWKIRYVFDNIGNVTITPSYYKTSASSMTVYDVSGSGTYDNTTKALSVDYSVIKNVYTLKNDGTTSTVKTTADASTDIMTKH